MLGDKSPLRAKLSRTSSEDILPFNTLTSLLYPRYLFIYLPIKLQKLVQLFFPLLLLRARETLVGKVDLFSRS